MCPSLEIFIIRPQKKNFAETLIVIVYSTEWICHIISYVLFTQHFTGTIIALLIPFLDISLRSLLNKEMYINTNQWISSCNHIFLFCEIWQNFCSQNSFKTHSENEFLFETITFFSFLHMDFRNSAGGYPPPFTHSDFFCGVWVWGFDLLHSFSIPFYQFDINSFKTHSQNEFFRRKNVLSCMGFFWPPITPSILGSTGICTDFSSFHVNYTLQPLKSWLFNIFFQFANTIYGIFFNMFPNT